jgi:hypothetical protein
VAAVPAISINAADPGDSGAASQRQLGCRAADYLADDLVAWNELRAQRRQISFRNMKVSAADSAGQHAQQHVARLQWGTGHLPDLEHGRAPGHKNGSLHFLASSSLILWALTEYS